MRAGAIAAVAAGVLLGCSGDHLRAGQPTAKAVPGPVVRARAAAQRSSAAAQGAATQILFGDLHVHTTFSADAFLLSLPVMGGEGAHPPADACDFARYCAGLDFFSLNDHAEALSPRHWRESIDAVLQCNAVGNGAEEPDLVAFLGWEWTQVGTTPADHFGHKNVVLLETAPDRVPARPIAAPRPEFRAVSLPATARWLLPILYFSERQRFFDYQAFVDEIEATPLCPADVPTRELPANCSEVAATPRDLFERLEDWNQPSLVIPHGTSWGLMTPPAFDIARELRSSGNDAERQRLFEIYSGHGNAEPYRSHRAARTAGGRAVCPAPSEDFLPCCWQAGEIIRGRCETPESAECEARVAQARQHYVDAGVSGHRTVPGAQVKDWLDCDQCRDCFNPAYSHRPGGSAQYALAVTEWDEQGRERRYRFGFIGSSDTHHARPGNGFKEFGRIGNTEARFASGTARWFTGDDREPVAASVPVVPSELPLAARRYTERGDSFLLTGGLVAVHARSRDRETIFEALESRQVYGTSGDRILLWFDLLNGPDGPVGMGSEVSGLAEAPRFRVRAAGAFEQKPGCPQFVGDRLGAERVETLCRGECYHPDDRRRLITRIEVVRIHAQKRPDEDVGSLIEDPWRVFDCPPEHDGCTVEFEDPDHLEADRESIYYVRAIQEPTLAVNAGGLRCERDASGACVAASPCYSDDRTDRDDDCLAENEERAWSSPIFVSPVR